MLQRERLSDKCASLWISVFFNLPVIIGHSVVQGHCQSMQSAGSVDYTDEGLAFIPCVAIIAGLV